MPRQTGPVAPAPDFLDFQVRNLRRGAAEEFFEARASFIMRRAVVADVGEDVADRAVMELECRHGDGGGGNWREYSGMGGCLVMPEGRKIRKRLYFPPIRYLVL